MFAAYGQRLVRKNFHSVRISRDALPPPDSAQSMVVYFNHASWWDPMICYCLADQYFKSKSCFGPIDSKALERYRFFSHLGLFGVEQNTARGARDFLRTSQDILSSPKNMIWMTPQGKFTDVRERPLQFRQGLGSLARQCPETSFIPMAMEYVWWTERQAEVLISFGQPLIPSNEKPRNSSEWSQLFCNYLTEVQDGLAKRSCQREAGDWIILNRGTSGVNKIYDSWRWLRAKLERKQFSAEHQPEMPR